RAKGSWNFHVEVRLREANRKRLVLCGKAQRRAERGELEAPRFPVVFNHMVLEAPAYRDFIAAAVDAETFLAVSRQFARGPSPVAQAREGISRQRLLPLPGVQLAAGKSMFGEIIVPGGRELEVAVKRKQRHIAHD